jgi:nucleoside-diphosphate-sugar epimerase
MKSLLVTGANGFIGNRLCRTMAAQGYSVAASVRRRSVSTFERRITVCASGDIGSGADWMPALRGVDVVVHLAGRARVLSEASRGPLQEHRMIHLEGTRRLAESAARAGVGRLVFVSSIKVNGEFTSGSAFTEDDAPAPQDPYAVSKWEAEVMLRDLSARSQMEVVIVRPPLVYGPGVKGNLRRLMQHIAKGYPLPLQGIDNRRSMISLDNLVDALILAATTAAAAGQTFLVGDEEPVSTSDLAHEIARAMGKKACLFTFPRILIPALTRLRPSLRPVIQRLTESLVVDSSRIRSVINWAPRQRFRDAVDSMVQAYNHT